MNAATRNNIGLLVLRLAIGLIAMYYGAGKLFGVFGGAGIKGTVGFMGSMFGIPPIFAILAMCGEFFGGLGMVVGALTPLAAFGFASVMAVATYENWKTPGLIEGVFLRGNPEQASRMFYTVGLFAGAFALMLMGAGDYSLDAKLFRGKKKRGR